MKHGELSAQIVRADQLVQKIKEMDNQVKEEMTEKQMSEIAYFFLEKNQTGRTDYAEKYEKLLEKVELSQEKGNIAGSVTAESDETKDKLIAELKAFRLERSRQEQVKAYYIFNDAQMEDLIKKNPKDKDELCQVSGFGKVKAEKYGNAILEILRKVGR